MELLAKLINPVNKILIVGAHPDDVEFSTGRLILRRKGKNTFAICMTDGYKGQEGTPVKKIISENEYVKLRVKESTRALKEFNIDLNNMFFMGCPDQDLVSNPYIIDKIFMLIRKIKPDFVLIPPWEGAHPDHDATHLFMRVALQNLNFGKDKIIEYGSYNNFGGRFNIQEFIPKNTKNNNFIPTPNEQKRWNNIMRTFKSQINQQKYYIPMSKSENYRFLPDYDYKKLPYESKQSEIIRQIINPIYPVVKKILPKKDKLFYETWESNINPNTIKRKLDLYVKHYGIQ